MHYHLQIVICMNDIKFSPLDVQDPLSSLLNSQLNETSNRTANHVHMRGLSAFGVQDVNLFRPGDFQQVCPHSFSLCLDDSLSPGNHI